MSRHEDEIARLVAEHPHCRAEVTPAETLCARGRLRSLPLDVERIMRLQPCGDWPRMRVGDLLGDRTVSLADVLREESIPVADRLWVACQPGVWAEPDMTLRWLAADFAAAALPIFEGARPGDARPRRAIEAARLCALGLIGTKTMASAGAAARAAAGDAARAAAWAAAWDAGDAARAAARAAAWAAGDAARAAARAAAWAAAWDAAWDAARAAGDAAGDAGDAARAAARAAAGDAQIRRVLDLLGAS